MLSIKIGLLCAIMICAAWQDWKRHAVSLEFLLVSGILGIVFCLMEKRTCAQVLPACGIGICMLVTGRLTGAIGAGDGWFFVVLGLFLEWRDSLALLMSGVFLCFCIGLFWTAGFRRRRGIKNRTLPFLPFLLPGGIGLLIGKGIFF